MTDLTFIAGARDLDRTRAYKKQGERTELLLVVGLLCMCWAPMIPNHVLPWAAFYSESVAIFGFGLLCVHWLCDRRNATTWPALSIACLALAGVPLLQAATGLIFFWGDAWMAAAYLLLLGLAIAVGSAFARDSVESAHSRLIACLFLGSAIASVGLAFVQWLRLDLLGIFVADPAPNGRMFANFGQPNQLATWLCLGLAAAHTLYQRRWISTPALLVTTAFLCLGISMTQSRTGMLEVMILCLALMLLRKRAALRVRPEILLSTLLLTTAFLVAWPSVNKAMLLQPGRSLDEQAEGGVRLIHWATQLDAIGDRPLLGYGWNQAAVAQGEAATRHSPSREFIEHSHNIAIDVLVWNGVPLGAVILGTLGWWMWSRWRQCRSDMAALALTCLGVLSVHALLEFPLEYAYFLLPFGMLIGALDAQVPRTRRAITSRSFGIIAVGAAGVLLTWIGRDYLLIEENNTLLRFEFAGIVSPDNGRSKPPEVLLLTQQRELLRFARTQATRGMSASELRWMRQVSERYSYPPVLLRYAVAAGLNGEPESAGRTMTLLCTIHPRARCTEGLQAWTTMSKVRYPELARVALPSLPGQPK
jgi:hypothetical protein